MAMVMTMITTRAMVVNERIRDRNCDRNNIMITIALMITVTTAVVTMAVTVTRAKLIIQAGTEIIIMLT